VTSLKKRPEMEKEIGKDNQYNGGLFLDRGKNFISKVQNF
jgi:hypothetical protein